MDTTYKEKVFRGDRRVPPGTSSPRIFKDLGYFFRGDDLETLTDVSDTVIPVLFRLTIKYKRN